MSKSNISKKIIKNKIKCKTSVNLLPEPIPELSSILNFDNNLDNNLDLTLNLLHQKDSDIKSSNIKPSILEDNNYDIKYIIHTGDIHIRLFEREEEYKSVFNRFYDDLKNRNLNKTNSVIVITGDIMHDKENIHPTSLELCTNFLSNLTSITNIILIAGNHDMCDNNPNINTLKSIISTNFFTHNKIYFIDDNTTYLYNNIIFGLTKVYDLKITPCVLSEDYSNKIKIGLYHGRVISHLNENEMFFVKDDSVNYKEFKDYDYVLLGDIHQQQYLNEEKTIAYCGSLIQQNKSESINKGYLLWNLKKKSSEFIIIPNDHVTLKITIGSDGKWKKALFENAYPKYLKLDILSNSENKKDIESVYDWYSKKGSQIVELNERFEVHKNKINDMININNSDTNSNDNKGENKGENNSLCLLSNKEKICDLILKGIKDEFKNESLKTKIKDLVKGIKIKDSSVKNIRLHTLKFDNFMKYGEGNIINFNNLKNINGLFSSNSEGKSTIIDVILYSIYGECTRGSTIDLINNQSKRMSIEIELEVNGIKYKITRKAVRNGNKQFSRKVGTELIIYENDKNISSDIKKNTKVITEKICPYEDFIHNCIISQNTKVNFLNFTPKEKNEYLYKIFNIEVLKDIDKNCANIVRNMKTELTRKKKNLSMYSHYGTTSDEIIKKMQELLEQNQKNHFEKEKDMEISLEESTKIKTKFINLENSLNNYVLELNKYKSNNSINITTQEYKKLKINQEKIKKDNIAFKSEFEKLNKKAKIKSQKILNKNDKIIEEFNKDRDIRIKSQQDKINELRTQIMNDTTFNINKYDKKEIKKEIKSNENDLSNKKRLLNTNINEIEIQNKIVNTKSILINQKRLDEYLNKEQELIKFNTENGKFQQIIEELNSKLEEYKEYEYDLKCKFCVKNNNVKDKLILETKIKDISSQIEINNKLIKSIDKFKDNNKDIIENNSRNIKLEEEKVEATNKLKLLEKDNNMLELQIQTIDKYIEDKKLILEKMSIFDNNKNVIKKIEELEEELEEIRKEECKEYINYIQMNKEFIEINEELEDMRKKLDYDEELIEYNQSQLDLYENNQDKIKLFNELEENIKTINKQIETNKINNNTFNTKITALKTTLVETTEKINKLKIDMGTFKIFNEDLNKIKADKDEYEIISNFISGEDFTIKIMQTTVLPNITENINKMLRKYSDYEIQMVLNQDTNDSVYIYKTDGSNLSLNGGYECHLINLIFRIVFSKISGVIRTNFIIIDEAFDASDQKNKKNIKNIIDFMDNIYDWGIIISHDLYIKSNFDKHITIKKNNNKQLINI
jgi:DNA repair exonuclease SbcCD ATPase subunit/predicted MPP superfamily phosphohydrolase